MVLAIVSSGITLADPIPKASVEIGSKRMSAESRKELDEEIKDYDEPKDNEFLNFSGRFLSVMSANGGSRTVAGLWSQSRSQ